MYSYLTFMISSLLVGMVGGPLDDGFDYARDVMAAKCREQGCFSVPGQFSAQEFSLVPTVVPCAEVG